MSAKPPKGLGWNPHTGKPIVPQTVRARERECGAWTILAVTIADGELFAMNHRTGESWGDGQGVELARELRRLGLAGEAVALATDTPGELYEYLSEYGPKAGAGFKAEGSCGKPRPT